MEKAVLLYMVILVFHHFGVEVGVAQTVEASFNDSSCNKMVCPDTPLLFTCTVTGSDDSVARVRLPSGVLIISSTSNTTSLEGSLPDGVTVQSNEAVLDGGVVNYSLTLAIERASILTGSAVICEDGALSPKTDQAMCPVGTAQPPQNLRHIVSSNTDDSAEIQWQRPVVTEGSEISISSYSVVVSDEADGQVMPESVLDDGDGTFSHTISGLVYNTNYTVEVTATNSCGDTSDPVSIYVFIEARVPPKPTLGPLQMNCSEPLKDSRSVTINWMLGMGEPGLVYPGEDRSTVLLSPDADDNNCENVLGTSCKTKVSMKGDYNVNLTIHNGIGDSDPERSSFFSGALLIDNNLTDRQPSVTVTINKYCFEAFYIVTVRFGKSKESDIDSCDYRQTEKASLMPADGKEFHVNTTLIKLNDNDNEMYCFNATLEEVSSTDTPPTPTEGGLDPPVIVGIAVAAIVLIFGVIIGIIIAYLIYRKLTHTSNKDDQEMKTLGANSPDSPAPTCQDPSTISRTPHPTTGELYTQDPSTIEHQEAPGGELYAMPQKPSKKGKKKEEEAHELTEKEKAAALYSVPDRKGQKAKSEGLTYAQLDIHTSNKQAPPSQGSTYADIRL